MQYPTLLNYIPLKYTTTSPYQYYVECVCMHVDQRKNCSIYSKGNCFGGRCVFKHGPTRRTTFCRYLYLKTAIEVSLWQGSPVMLLAIHKQHCMIQVSPLYQLTITLVTTIIRTNTTQYNYYGLFCSFQLVVLGVLGINFVVVFLVGIVPLLLLYQYYQYVCSMKYTRVYVQYILHSIELYTYVCSIIKTCTH